MPTAFWVAFVIIFAGQLCWLLAAESAKKWLVQNDPTFVPSGIMMNAFLGRLITSFGPMARYGRLRRERNEPTTLLFVFWGGFVFSMLGAAGLLIGLASL